jgi:hypothetical protein
MGPTLPEVVRIIEAHGKGPLQVTLGRYVPRFVLRHADGRYEVRRLVSDTAREKADRTRQIAEGTYVPEMTWASLVPGPIVLEAVEKAEFLCKLKAWPEREGL